MENVYNEEFFRLSLRSDRLASYKILGKFILRNFDPKSVIDYGCGCGWLIKYLRDNGEGIDVRGVEKFVSEMWKVQKDNIRECIVYGDVTKPLPRMSKVDLSICLEVAEHIKEEYSSMLIHNICQNTNRVVFSAAPPGQGGIGHINEKDFYFWEIKFKERGFVINRERTTDFRKFLHINNAKKWYTNNIAVMERV